MLLAAAGVLLAAPKMLLTAAEMLPAEAAMCAQESSPLPLSSTPFRCLQDITQRIERDDLATSKNDFTVVLRLH